MKKIIAGLFSMLALAGMAHAQSAGYGKNSIGMSVGWQQVHFLDQHASPLEYKATATPLVGINYTHSGSHSYLKLNVSGGVGSADPVRSGARDYLVKWSDKDSFQYRISSLFANASVEATYLRKLNPASTGPVSYWLGGTVNDQAYYADEVANMPWLINTAEFSPSFKMDYQPGSRHLFSIQMDFTAVAFVTRTVYGLFAKSSRETNINSYLKQGTRFSSVRQYRKVNLEFSYNCHLTHRVAMGATYALRWMQYSYPKTLSAADNRFYVNLNYSLHQ